MTIWGTYQTNQFLLHFTSNLLYLINFNQDLNYLCQWTQTLNLSDLIGVIGYLINVHVAWNQSAVDAAVALGQSARLVIARRGRVGIIVGICNIHQKKTDRADTNTWRYNHSPSRYHLGQCTNTTINLDSIWLFYFFNFW